MSQAPAPAESPGPAERHEFQAEVKQLLDLMVHSLYSDKDIFLRELISNASDALDKLRFEQLTRTDLAASDLHIRIDVDRTARTVSVSDNGIGMTRDEVVKNIGTIARSGTREFLTSISEAQKDAQTRNVPPELIGQFGVGFYSAFMVADRITLVSRRAGQTTATRWESTGDGSYTLAEAERPTQGTTVTLHLKPADPEHSEHGRDYTADHVLKDIVKRYSDFVTYPIRMQRWRDGDQPSDPKVLEDETLNSMKAIWDRPRGEVTDTEYKEFYRHVAHDWTDPLRSIPIKIEGTLEAYALLYIPGKAPFDLYSAEMKRGVQLYVKRVFVMDECKELMPTHLRFVRGVVDAHDLSLNVSREILQKDRQIPVIRKQLVKKVLATLEDMKRGKLDERSEELGGGDPAGSAGGAGGKAPRGIDDDYLAVWAAFGPVLKEGLLAFAAADKDKLLDLVVAHSTHAADKMASLDDYVSRMKEGQDAIYFLAGPSYEAIARSPLLEAFTAKGYEVLLFTDPVDELWLERASKFKDKPLTSISRGEVKLGSDDERKQAAEALDEKQKEFADLLAYFRVQLQDEVKEVRLSSRLTSSPVCLVSDEHDLTPRMQKMLEQLGQKPPRIKPILELNPAHPLLPKLHALFAANKADPRLATYAQVLLGQAHLADSGQLPDPAGFARALGDLMLHGV
ncbi:MAG TPA: molecular chaperone HtpG [Kofleriaceae bacterium]|nr:molecular chaperone HtpG [Kofleriaceae bacterium]